MLTRRVCLLFKRNNRSDRERLSGILRYTADHPHWEVRIIDRSSPRFAIESRQIREIWKPHGVIYTADPRSLSALQSCGCTKTLRCRIDPPDDMPETEDAITIRADIRQLTNIAATHLQARGFKNFAFFGTESHDECEYSSMVERHFHDSLRATNNHCAVFRCSCNMEWEKGIQAAAKWVESLSKPCGVLAYSDELARLLLNACRVARVRVPEQIGIIGIDDEQDLCESSRPTITSIKPDFEIAGYMAAQYLELVFRRQKLKSRRHFFYGIKRLTERASTCDLRGCGRHVSAATEIIRNADLEHLSVTSLTQQMHISRRLLEMHFKTILGHGIHSEIVRRRLKEMSSLLEHTKMPIGSVVQKCGFRTLNAAQVAFKKHFGVTMTAWRNNTCSLVDTKPKL